MIPLVKKYKTTNEYFSVFKGFTAANAGSFISEKVNDYCIGSAKIPKQKTDENYYYFVISRSENPDWQWCVPQEDEGYFLILSDDLIFGCSKSQRGLFYAFKTFEKLSRDGSLPVCEITDFPDNSFRAFHMDMRYGFPSLGRMLEIIEILSDMKFNTFIIEYENRFPYQKHSDICDADCFTPEDIEKIIEYTKERFIKIIPLQQTIGHMEYLLKHDKYYPLREVREFPKTACSCTFSTSGFKHFNDIDEICASSSEAYEISKKILSEMIKLHPESEYIHIGCDEAWNLLSCEDCKREYENDKNRLYTSHISKMAKIVTDSKKIPVIWDDMLQKFSEKELKRLKELNPTLVIMCWLYYASQYQKAVTYVKKYKDVGFEVLGASAAKCSEGPEPQYLDMPWYSQRMNGIDMWARVCGELSLDGFCHTCWSNYSGTIAPPHPFFDTTWYTTAYAAQSAWNASSSQNGFDTLFIEDFFGVKGKSGGFDNRNEQAFYLFDEIVSSCKDHLYEAEAMRVMSLLSAYRQKSLFVHRELYRLRMNITAQEKNIIKNRLSEVKSLRDRLMPMVFNIIAKHYTKKDCEIFINSRFEADTELENAYEKDLI